MPFRIKIIQDISLLYELSLSVGSSLDPRVNCQNFLNTITRRKSLNFSSIWLNKIPEKEVDGYELFEVCPNFRKSNICLSNHHFILKQLEKNPYFNISHHDPNFKELVQEKKVTSGSYAIFKLGNIGFLKLFANNRENGFSDIEMAQLKQVVDKLNISLDGCFAHIQLKEETQQRLEAQQAIKESEEKYRGALENMELGLLEVNPDGHIIRANNAICQMLGYQADELVGKQERSLYRIPEDSENVLTNWTYANTPGRHHSYELQFNHKNGAPVWVLMSRAPVINPHGQNTGSFGIYFDITARKTLEQELSDAKMVAERARLAERQFITHMSHEIRTPINAVIGMTHLLSTTKLDETQKDYLNSLDFSAKSLLGIIDNILDLSKIDAGVIEFEQQPFDLDYFQKNLVRSFKFKSEEKNLLLYGESDPDIDHIVVGDPIRLNQILTNLLANALKFTENGEVSLHVKLLSRSAGKYLIQFRVHDTGIGIPEDKLDTIFEYFKQADPQISRKFGGTGLGLTIVKQLVEMQGGTIHIESEEGKGSDFIFELSFGDSGIPVESRQEHAGLEYQTADNRIAGSHVMIVEDNLLNQKLLCKTLEGWDCTYAVAHNSAEAINLSKQQQFDIILMDIHMPDQDGFETTGIIRNDTQNINKTTPIIALTAAAMADEKRKALDAGMNSFLTKPISPNSLLDHLCQYIKPSENAKKAPQFCKPLDFTSNEPDLSYLKKISNGDPEFILGILNDFKKEADQAVAELERYAQEGDLEKTFALLHKLQPNFAMLGLNTLCENSKTL
ncbi:MAG: ATP-binding protein [Saprospiraceae bacterium]